METLYILTNFYGSIPQVMHETDSLNIYQLKNYLSRRFVVNIMTLEEVQECLDPDSISGCYFFYSSSQFPSYKKYIEDILQYILISGGILIPRFELFLCHENKSFQYLMSKRYHLDMPFSYLVSSLEHFKKLSNNITFPCILKKADGSSSSSVWLINTISEGVSRIKKNMAYSLPKGKNLFRHYRYKNKYIGKLPLYSGSYLVQKFLDDCSFDWKVLNFSGKFFVLKRFPKEGDFKSSGSGNFHIDPIVEDSLLEFAKNISSRLRTTFVSLDISMSNGSYYLLEFQPIHFGLYTLLNSKFYYCQNGNEWQRLPNVDFTPEKMFGEAIVSYVNEMASVVR